MNGIHDMGGMHGFGPIPIEPNEPVFHADWEARALAITVGMGGWRRWNLDASRRAREEIPPATYLNYSYYERWIHALERIMVERGVVTEEELRSGQGKPIDPQLGAPMDAEAALGMLRRGGPSERASEAEPRFAVGDQVRTINRHPAGHTRLPRYARGHTGVIVRHYGAHVLPDTNAHFQGENPGHLYAVRFSAQELWGADASPTDSVMLDLWEPYLEAV
jgi:nitrile hydratase beta subunit